MSPAQLKKREDAIDNMVYDLSDNAETVFTKIDDFQDLYTILKWPKIEQQLINYAYLIFQRVNVFQDYLIKWNKREEDPRQISKISWQKHTKTWKMSTA